MSAGGGAVATLSVALPWYVPPGATSHASVLTLYVPAGGLLSVTFSCPPDEVELPTVWPAGP